MTSGTTPPRWARFTDERLLDTRMCDLGVELEGTWLEGCLERLGEELAARELRFRPHAWLSSEWFSPTGVPGIAIPFYLAHPRLQRLERSQMLEVEGGRRDECMKILRHECGHAVQQAFRLHRRKRWRELFGSSTARYPDHYRPDPTSRRFVQHLRFWYAQSHPDEDFAETFAVWLGPPRVWRRRYADWPALAKLEYVDEVMTGLAGTTPPVRSRRRVDPLSRLKKTLREHYAERTARYRPGAPDRFDRELRRLFEEGSQYRHAQKASRFLRRHRASIRRLVCRWTGEYQFAVDQVLADMIVRCRALDLRAVGDEEELRMDFAVMLTVCTMQYLFRHRDWIAL